VRDDLDDRAASSRTVGAVGRRHRATIGSVATGVWSQALLVLSGVISARTLGVEDRGRLALLALFPIVLAQLGAMGVPLAVTFRVASGRATARAAVRTVRSLALGQAGLVVVAHLALLELLAFPGQPGRMEMAGFITLAWTPAALLQMYAQALLQGQERFRAFNVLRVLPGMLASLLIGVIALAGEASLASLAAAWTAAYVIGAAASIAVGLRGASGSRGEAVEPRGAFVAFGLRGLLGSSSPLETFRLDQAVVGLVISQAALGIYVVAVAFTNLPRFIAQSIGMVAYPRVAAEADEAAARRSLWTFAAVATAAASAVAGALALAAGWIVPLFFGSAFGAAVTPCRILLVASVFFSARRVLSDGARGIGSPGLGTVAEVVTWIILVPAVLVMAPLWGVNGVAAALSLAAAAGAVFLVAALVWQPARLHIAEGTAS
jgi:O-antigen/teichoic acid export membrane protein